MTGPIRGQYSGHVMSLDQSETSIYLGGMRPETRTWSPLGAETPASSVTPCSVQVYSTVRRECTSVQSNIKFLKIITLRPQRKYPHQEGEEEGTVMLSRLSSLRTNEKSVSSL